MRLIIISEITNNVENKVNEPKPATGNWMKDISRGYQLEKVSAYDHYSSLPSYEGDNPLDYWSTIEKHLYWPIRQIALALLTIPASSYPCERMFSAAGRL
jgi:hypothetical protein